MAQTGAMGANPCTQSGESLRFLLRRRTRASHDHVDGLFSTLDLTSRDDYRRFLLANALAFAHFPLVDTLPVIASYVTQTRSALASDLVALDRTVPDILPEIAAPERVEPIAALYVLGGASFGRRILYDRWSQSSDPAVLAGGRYLSGADASQLWRDFLTHSKDNPVPLAGVEALVTSANAIFDMFSDAFSASDTTVGSGERHDKGTPDERTH